MAPIAIVGKLSIPARIGSRVPCRPWPVIKMDTPINSAAIGARICFIG